MAEAVPFYYGY